MSTPLGPEELQPRPWIARLLGVAPSSTHKMDLPVAVGGGRGRPAMFVPSACVAARLRQIEGRAGAAGDLDPQQERALRDRSQAELARQLHRRRSGDLIEVAEVRHAWLSIVVAVRAKLLRLPSAMADVLAHAATPAEVQRILDAEIRVVLTELSQTQPIDTDTPNPPAPTPRRKRSPR